MVVFILKIGTYGLPMGGCCSCGGMGRVTVKRERKAANQFG